jgi:hypothetical protein
MAKVLFIAPLYRQYPILLHSLVAQSDSDWELWLVHDGPVTDGIDVHIANCRDQRVVLFQVDGLPGNWGHGRRRWALEKVQSDNHPCHFIVITNPDNYYVPAFIEAMLAAFQDNDVAVYCSMLHNYMQWQPIDSGLWCGGIDGGCIMVRRNAALAVGWRSLRSEADWDYIHDLMQRFDAERLRKLPRFLFVHN